MPPVNYSMRWQGPVYKCGWDDCGYENSYPRPIVLRVTPDELFVAARELHAAAIYRAQIAYHVDEGGRWHFLPGRWVLGENEIVPGIGEMGISGGNGLYDNAWFIGIIAHTSRGKKCCVHIKDNDPGSNRTPDRAQREFEELAALDEIDANKEKKRAGIEAYRQGVVSWCMRRDLIQGIFGRSQKRAMCLQSLAAA